MALFHVRIMASNKTFFNGDVQMVVLPALDGECGIMARMRMRLSVSSLAN